MRTVLYETPNVSQIVIGLADGISHEACLEIGYGIEEQGLLYRFHLKDSGTEASDIAVFSARASGLGVGIGLDQSRCVVVVKAVGKCYPLIEQNLSRFNESERGNVLRMLGKQAARLALQKPLE